MLNVNVTIEVRSLVSEAAKHFKLTMASRRAAFSDNTSLIATLSSSFCKADRCQHNLANSSHCADAEKLSDSVA